MKPGTMCRVKRRECPAELWLSLEVLDARSVATLNEDTIITLVSVIPSNKQRASWALVIAHGCFGYVPVSSLLEWIAPS